MDEMKQLVTRHSAFWSAFFLGMASPLVVGQVNRYPYPYESELDAMRGDWIRVGGDLTRAIEAGNVKEVA